MGIGQCLDKKQVIPYIFQHLLLRIIISLSAISPIMIIFIDVVMVIFFSYRNA